MPFTVSHAAVAAPLARRGLILSAVAIGSMAPDFEYFLRLSVLMLLAIAVQYWRWFRRTTPSSAPLTTFLDVRSVLAPWAVIGGVAMASGFAYAAATALPIHDLFAFRVFGGRVVLASISMLVIEFILFGWFRARQPVTAEGDS